MRLIPGQSNHVCLDNPQLDLEDDAQDTAAIEEEEETEQTVEDMAIEMTDHEKLRHELRLFMLLYTTEKNEMILGALKAPDWDDYLEMQGSIY